MAKQPNDIDLDAIVETAAPSSTPDSKTLLEERDLERQEYRAHIDGLLQDMAERKKYAGRIFWLLGSWLAGMFALLLLQGLLSPRGWFQLSENVLLAAIGGTTLNVIGIFLVVARYLFPQRTPLRQRKTEPSS